MKKKYFILVFSIIVFLAIFIPLASNNPDGLEKIVQTSGVNEQKPLWTGLFTDYSILFIGNSYLSTLIAGIVGTMLVLIVSLFVAKVIVPKKSK